MQGFQLLSEFTGCEGDITLLRHPESLRKLCLSLAMLAGLTVTGDSFVAIDELGITGVLMMGTSHVLVHTWAEARFTTIDIAIVAPLPSAAETAHLLFQQLNQHLRPEQVSVQEIELSQSPTTSTTTPEFPDQRMPRF